MGKLRRTKRWGGPLIALVVAVLSFLPVGAWIAALPDSEYHLELIEWVAGSVIAAGGGLVLTVLARDWKWLWPSVDGEALTRWTERNWSRIIAAIAILAGACYVACALFIFKRRAALIDEMVQIIQARIFANGHLWVPAPRHPEFFSSLNIVNANGRAYSQFPPGGPAFIALGVLIGASWIVGPLFGTLSVIAFARFASIAEPHRPTAAMAVLLMAVAPFTVFMSGSHMNHVTTGFCLIVSIAALAMVTRSDEGQDIGPIRDVRETPGGRVFAPPLRSPGWAFINGLGLGTAATIRPVDALAFALPAALWYVVRTLRDRRRWVEMIASGVGVAIPMAAMLYVNQHTTGSPLLFGYEVLWGRGHDLGFHRSPMGTVHTPAIGLAYINDYFVALQRYLFETPLPSLVPAIGALWLTRGLRSLDRYLIASSVVLLGCYFAYWHPGYFMGPRFVYPLIPIIALWTARFPGLWHRYMNGPAGPVSRGRQTAYRSVMFALAVSVVVAVVYGIPQRAEAHAAHLSPPQMDRPQGAQDSAVRHALVFVRESWESQLVTRLWALGVSHVDAEEFYHDVDACRLDHAIAQQEAIADARGLGDSVAATLRPLMRDSLRIVANSIGLNGSIRVEPGFPYTPDCIARVRETEAGVLPLTPYAMLQGDSNIYARDLHARDTILMKEYAGRPVYLLRPESPDSMALPHFYPLNLDSAKKDWGETPEINRAG